MTLQQLFAELLAQNRALSMLYQTLHWQSKGQTFYGDHILFERIYGGIQKEIDALAEKGVNQGGNATVNLKENLALVMKYVPESSQVTLTEDGIRVAITLEKAYIKYISDYMKKGISEGTKNLLADIVDNHEGNLYLLNQRLK